MRDIKGSTYTRESDKVVDQEQSNAEGVGDGDGGDERVAWEEWVAWGRKKRRKVRSCEKKCYHSISRLLW
jgi:hypothetical protein